MRRVAVLLALLAPVTARAGVVINELYPDPPSTDGGNEWLELYNPDTTSAVDVSGYTIEVATSSFSAKATLPSGATIPAGGFYVVGEEFVTTADFVMATGDRLSMGNASTSGDAVRLKDAGGTVVDTVIYGPDNSDLFLDDTGLVATSVAKMSGSGESIARVPDGTDTNQSGADFVVLKTPTPGATNGSGGGTDTGGTDTGTSSCSTGGYVAINELMPNPSGSDTGAEWVELYNPGVVVVDVSGWALAAGTSSFSSRKTIPSGTTIDPGGFLVLSGDAVPSLGNASSSGDAVRLEDCAGGVVDTVVYGPDNADAFPDDSGATATSWAPEPVEGKSLARKEDGLDTNQSGDDFVVAPYDTEGISNTSPPVDCGASVSGLKINEILPDPVGSDAGGEWIELYNAGTSTLDLTGWEIESSTSGSWSSQATFPAVTLDPGGFLVVSGPATGFGDVVDDGMSLPNGTNGDGVRVVDCKGYPADTVVYGKTNSDGISDDSGDVASSIAPDPGEGISIQRWKDGADTDKSGDDFVLQGTPTPGEPNPVIDPDPCVPSAGTVTINEVYDDPDGTDDGQEWFELYNAGDASVSLSGWSLATAGDATELGNDDVMFTAGTSIPGGGFLVVGGPGVVEADLVKTFSLGNGTGGDALRLYDCEGTGVDTVIWGTGTDDGLTDDAGEVVDPYGNPDVGQSLARVEDGADTNAADDWFVDGTPTPGTTNFQDDHTGDHDPGTGAPGCGCGALPSDAPDSPRSCSTAPFRPSLLGLVGALALVRRRRHRGLRLAQAASTVILPPRR